MKASSFQAKFGNKVHTIRTTIRTAGKTPTTILYTDEQIADIQTMCCTGQTVLGVDKTFNLCKMHVTVTSYKQMTVTSDKTDEHPVFIGPMFLHDNSDYETYSYFFHHLRLKLETNLTRLVIGTDEDQAMVKAIMTEFTESSHVLCTRHLKENTRQQLIDDGVPVTERQTIMTKIFGADGLVNATDDACFNDLCQSLLEYCSNFSMKFVQYFNKRLGQNLKTKVNLPMRECIVAKDWTNNNSESINHVLKQTVNWVRLARRVVNGQFQELRSALLSAATKWNHAAILLLMAQYEANKEKFASSVHKNKDIWRKIGAAMHEKGHSFSGEECDKKFRMLKHRHKVIADSNSKSGRGSTRWEWFKHMDGLLAGDPAVKPLKIVSSLEKEPVVCENRPPLHEIAIPCQATPTKTTFQQSDSNNTTPKPVSCETPVKRRITSQEPPEWFKSFSQEQSQRLANLEKINSRMVAVAEERNEILKQLVQAMTKKSE